MLAHRAARSRDPRRAMAGVALMGAIGGFIIANATFDVLAFAQVPYMLMYVLALTVVAADRSEAEEARRRSRPLWREPGFAPAPHRRARVTRPPRRPVDAPRRPSAPRAPVSQPRRVRRPLSAGSRWPRRLRGPHVEMPARTRWTAMTLSATAMAVVLGLVMARAPSARLVPSAPAKRPTPAATGPSSSYARALNQVMSQLNAARASDGARLAVAHAPQVQAAAARQLSAAHQQAASAVLQLHPASAASANASLATSLKRAGDAYAALAAAAGRRDSRAYNSARASITQANRALDAAYAQLAKLGYRVA